MAKKTVQLPVTLFHKNNGTPEFEADPRHSKFNGQYPITVHTQEDYDRLGPGWHEDPVEAAAWVDPDAPVADEAVDPPPTGGHNAEPPAEEVQAAALLSANVDDAVEQIEEIESIAFLELLQKTEADGKDRKGVQAAITDRLEYLTQTN